MSNFIGLNTALSGLRAAQLGLDTVANNVANANTQGYTRQRVGLRPSLSLPTSVGPLGTGVTITGINRLRDGFLDARMRTSLGESAFQGTQALLLARAESAMGEPDNGVSAALGALWGAFEDWALDPSGTAPRHQVVADLDGVASRLRSISTGWGALEADTEAQIGTLTSAANGYLEQIAELNRLIPIQTTAGGPPTDLLDQRDLLADRLAELTGATAAVEADGFMTVSIGGRAVVVGAQAARLEREAGGLRIEGGPAAGERVGAGGELGAMLDFVTVHLPAQRAHLDAFAADLAAALEAHHADPALLVSADGGPVTAATIALNPPLAADPSMLTSGTDGPHDARTAEALAGLRGRHPDGTASLDQRWASRVVDLAGQVATAGRAAKAEHDLAVSAAVARQSAHGVSLDEEMAAVVQLQRSLEAMSRVMSAIDEALDVLINRTGIVGR